MIEIIRNTIEYLGPSNALSIILFLISVFIAFYLYHRTFYRLAYSTGRICKDSNNNETEFTSRIIFYNNGRKTITQKEIQQLEIKSSNIINTVRIIKGNENIKTTKNSKKINIDIDYIDSSEFFVLEVNHNGKLDVIGRISETGNLLNTEPKYWLILNITFMILFILMIFYNLTILSENKEPEILKFITNMFILFGIFSVLRFIHSILFIPDSLTSKYLDTKDEFAKEFKN